MEILLDPLFRTPFVVGLLVSLVLPLAGTLLRRRQTSGAAHEAPDRASCTALIRVASHGRTNATGGPALLFRANGHGSMNRRNR